MIDYSLGHSGTLAPLVAKDMVIAGKAGGESGIRGFIDARDAHRWPSKQLMTHSSAEVRKRRYSARGYGRSRFGGRSCAQVSRLTIVRTAAVRAAASRGSEPARRRAMGDAAGPTMTAAIPAGSVCQLREGCLNAPEAGWVDQP